MTSADAQIRIFERLRHATPGSTHLYLVRHGQTLGNVEHLLVGHTDMPLDDLGVRQARQVGIRLQSTPLDAIVASPLQRAQITAHEIARHHEAELTLDHRLKEINFGHAEGLTMAEAVSRYPEIMTLHTDPLDEHFEWPGGDVRSRFHTAIFATFTDIALAHQHRHVAVVCHGGVIGSLLAQLDGGSPNDYVTYPVANCSVTHLEIDLEGARAHVMNDIAHLDVVRTEPWTFTIPGEASTYGSTEE
ncbi:MAG: histidine phosphatase family protein [Chloroflexota bacterium]|nr:histidine phosphatase family protein [Chloroflexota bacterium]